MNHPTKTLILLGLALSTHAQEVRWQTPEFGRVIQHGAQTMITLRITDDEDAPVEGAQVGAHFQIEGRKGIVGVSDKDGLFVMRDISRGEVRYGVEKDGHYETRGEYRFRGIDGVMVKDGKWQPWNPVIAVTLRRIVEPIPMYAKRVETKIPSPGSSFGFDLVKGDWVAPHGSGSSADFLLHIDGYWNSYRDNDSTLQLRFSRDGDGIAAWNGDEGEGGIHKSEYKMPRYAPAIGYMREMSWRRARETGADGQADRIVNDLSEPKSYFFRVRSERAPEGSVVSAHYGKLPSHIEFVGAAKKGEGSWIKFTYYLNPTPNDRNMEFDPKRNLFKDLSSTEEVFTP